jgi:hypothetical protein
MYGLRYDRLHLLQHQGVRCMHKVRHVALGRRLQTKLSVRRHRVVHKDDAIRQLAVIEDLERVERRLVKFSELATKNHTKTGRCT